MAPRALAGFDRVTLDPGQTKHLTITVPRRSFQYWNVTSHTWTTAWGTRTFSVGASSRDIRLSGTNAPLKPAADEVRDLLAAVQGVGPGNSLTAKVTAIQGFVAANDSASTCSALTDLKSEVAAQRGKKISLATAAAIQLEADRVAASAGC
jgi:hypothetical protein